MDFRIWSFRQFRIIGLALCLIVLKIGAAFAQPEGWPTKAELLNDPRYQKTTLVRRGEDLPGDLFKGQPLYQAFQSRDSSGTNLLNLDQLLTLKQVTTGKEPRKVTFEVPVCYDKLNNESNSVVPHLMEDGRFIMANIDRATNGGCLLSWPANFQPPGLHALQISLLVLTGRHSSIFVTGPVTPFYSSNLCQFVHV